MTNDKEHNKNTAATAINYRSLDSKQQGASAARQKPRRRLLLNLHISADTPEALIQAIRRIEYNISSGHIENRVNGFGSDFEYTVDDDPRITADSYIEAVREFERV